MSFEFHEVRFPESVSWGSRGGPKFRTHIFESMRGYEKRNIEWSQPQMEFNAAFGIRTDVQMQSVIDFFSARQGMAHGFRFKNWNNYKIENGVIAVGDGVNTRLNMYKKHAYGAAVFYKRLYKIVRNSVTGVEVNGTPVTEGVDFAIDYDSGEMIFTSVLADDAQVTATTLEFDEPVRFNFDNMQVLIDAYNSNSLSQMPLIGFRGTFTAGTLFAPGGSTPGTDPFYDWTTLILLFDDADGATSTTDFSAQALAVTFNGDAAITRNQAQHGLGSLLPGTTGSVSVTGTTMQMGLKPFTIEVFAQRPTVGANTQPIISQWDETNDDRGWSLQYNLLSQQIQFVISPDGVSEKVITSYPWDPVEDGFFNHFSVDRLANGWFVFRIEGEVVQTVRSFVPIFDSTAPVHVGSYADTPSGVGSFRSYIDAVRITTGRSRYSDDLFDPIDTPAPYPIA